MKNKKSVAIVGTQGLPSKYGGFETLAYYLVKHLAEDYNITVFCSAPEYEQKLHSYEGARLKYVGLRANGAQSILFDIVSILRSAWAYDKVLILGASGGVILPFLWFKRNKFIMNFGGLDWKREKWGAFASRYLKFSEKLSVKYSEHLVADNQGIRNYIEQSYQKQSTLIAYGGDQAKPVAFNTEHIEKYPFLASDYAFSLARIQPDNNIEMILSAFEGGNEMPIVFVGNWHSSAYGKELKSKFQNKGNILLLDAIYDQEELNLLRSNCKFYVHGHSAGGTNPALVEAMNLGLPIFAYSSGFNEHTTQSNCIYFSSVDDLKTKIKTTSYDDLEKIGLEMLRVAKLNYQWDGIAAAYSKIFDK